MLERHVEGDRRGRVQNARGEMPGRGSEGFLRPASHELDRWREAVLALLEGDTATVAELVEA